MKRRDGRFWGGGVFATKPRSCSTLGVYEVVGTRSGIAGCIPDRAWGAKTGEGGGGVRSVGAGMLP